MQTQTSKKRPYRRHIRRDAAQSTVQPFHIKSGSRDDGTTWNPRIDTRTGVASCDCPGFRRWGHCYHTDRALQNCVRHGEIATVAEQPCLHCGSEAEFRCHDVPHAFICKACVETRADDLSDAEPTPLIDFATGEIIDTPEDIKKPVCPRCNDLLGEMGGEPFCFKCGEER